MEEERGPDGVDEATLLAAAGWADVPTARVLASVATDRVAVMVLDSNGGLGGRPHETIEKLTRDDAGHWRSAGDLGPAAGGGAGWFDGHSYAYGQAEPGVSQVLATVSDEVVVCDVQVDRWWIGIVAYPEPWLGVAESVPLR